MDSHLLTNILKNIQHDDELLVHVLFSKDKCLEGVSKCMTLMVVVS